MQMYQYKAMDSEIKPYPLFLGSISKDFTINMQKIGLNEMYNFFLLIVILYWY